MGGWVGGYLGVVVVLKLRDAELPGKRITLVLKPGGRVNTVAKPGEIRRDNVDVS